MNIDRVESRIALLATVVVIILAEWSLIQQNYFSGILLYSFILLLLLLYTAYRWERPQHQLLVLSIPAVIRLLNFTLPLGSLSPMFAQVVIAVPLALTGPVFTWLFGGSEFTLKINWRQIPFYGLFIVVGSLMGFVLYQFEQPMRLTWNSSLIFLFYIIVLLGAMALLEEWLFRGIMQSALSKLLGKGPGSLLVAIAYTILHINQGTWLFVLIIFLFAWGLSWLRNSSDGLFNVWLVHGAANLFFFLVLPWI